MSRRAQLQQQQQQQQQQQHHQSLSIHNYTSPSPPPPPTTHISSRITELPRSYEFVTLPECNPDRCVNDINYYNPLNAPKYDTANVKRLIITTDSMQPISFQHAPQYFSDDLKTDDSLRIVNNDISCVKYCEQVLKIASEELDSKRNNPYGINKDHNHNININNNNNTAAIHDFDSDYDSGPEDTSIHETKQSNTTTTLNKNLDNKLFHFAWHEAPVIADKIRYMTFTITLPSETMTHVELLSLLERDPVMKFNIQQEMLSLLKNESPYISNPTVRYHIKPLHIKIIEEHNELPISFNIQLTTRIPNTTTRQQWISPIGPNLYGGEILPTLNYVTTPNINRTSIDDQINLYIADEYKLNHPEASRWLDVNELYLRAQMQQALKQNSFYTIEAPESHRYTASNVLQFIVVSEWSRIIALCEHFHKPLPKIVEVDNKTKVFHVDSSVFNYIIDQKFQIYDKNQLLMRLEDIYITLTPIRQLDKQWHKDLSIVTNRIKNNNNTNPFIKYYLKLQIAYENYSGNKNESLSSSSSTTTNINHYPTTLYMNSPPPAATNATAARTPTNNNNNNIITNALGIDNYSVYNSKVYN